MDMAEKIEALAAESEDHGDTAQAALCWEALGQGPGSPAWLTAEPGDRLMRLKWDDTPRQNGSDFAHYNLYRKISGNAYPWV